MCDYSGPKPQHSLRIYWGRIGTKHVYEVVFFIPSTKLLPEFDTHIETRLLDDYSTYCAYIITGIPLPQAHMIPFFQLHNHFVVIAFYRVGFVTVFEDFTVTNRANLTVISGLCFRGLFLIPTVFSFLGENCCFVSSETHTVARFNSSFTSTSFCSTRPDSKLEWL